MGTKNHKEGLLGPLGFRIRGVQAQKLLLRNVIGAYIDPILLFRGPLYASFADFR